MKRLIIISLICFISLSLQVEFSFGKNDVEYMLRKPLMFKGDGVDAQRLSSFQTIEERRAAIDKLRQELNSILNNHKGRGRFTSIHWHEGFKSDLTKLERALNKDERAFRRIYDSLESMIKWVNSRHREWVGKKYTLEAMPRAGNLFMRHALTGTINLNDSPLSPKEFEDFKKIGLDRKTGGIAEARVVIDFENFMAYSSEVILKTTQSGRTFWNPRNKWLAGFGPDVTNEAIEAINLVLAYEKNQASQVVKEEPLEEEPVFTTVTEEERQEQIVVSMLNKPDLRSRIRQILKTLGIGDSVVGKIFAHIEVNGPISNIRELQGIEGIKIPDTKLPLIIQALFNDAELRASIGGVAESLETIASSREAI